MAGEAAVPGALPSLTWRCKRSYSSGVSSRPKQRKSTARIVGTVVFGLVIAGLTAIFATQIILQAWGYGVPETHESCRAGVQQLLVHLDQARQSAAAQAAERDALDAFRRALGQPWASRSALGRRCAEDPAAARLLRELEQLRYAEEHAVRYASRELAGRRRAVQAMADAMFAPQ